MCERANPVTTQSTDFPHWKINNEQGFAIVDNTEGCRSHSGQNLLSSGITTENGKAVGGQYKEQAVLEDTVSGSARSSSCQACFKFYPQVFEGKTGYIRIAMLEI